MCDAAEMWQNLVKTANTDEYLYNLHHNLNESRYK